MRYDLIGCAGGMLDLEGSRLLDGKAESRQEGGDKPRDIKRKETNPGYRADKGFRGGIRGEQAGERKDQNYGIA